MKRAIATPAGQPTIYEDLPAKEADKLQAEWTRFEQTRGAREQQKAINDMMEMDKQLKITLLKALAGDGAESEAARQELRTKLDVYKANQ